MKVPAFKLIAASLVAVAGLGSARGQNDADLLKKGFENPPAAARPQVWWHWMNGNITKEGIRLDLEWMHRIGLAGFHTFDATLSTPQVVKDRLPYMTPEWKDAFRYATMLADQLGMEEAIAGSPGWSESGGPWVPPSEAMKKYVWSETAVEGGKRFTGKLVHPPSITGPFQNVAFRAEAGSAENHNPIPEFYADSVVLAYRRADSDVSTSFLHARISSSGGSPDISMLSDGDLEKTTQLPIPPVGEKSWIQYEFAAPTTIRAITMAMKTPDRLIAIVQGISASEQFLEVSDDGENYRVILKLPADGAPAHTVAFPAVRAKFFRVTFKRLPAPKIPDWAAGLDTSALGIKLGPIPVNYEIAELVLHPGARVDRFEEKAAFTPEPDLYGFATPSVSAPDAIQKSDVIDLTGKMGQDGALDWTPPAGQWVVLRFGYSLIGTTNHPATAEATGLEVDKLDRRYVKHYMESYLNSYKETVGAEFMGQRGIRNVVNDSWEAGSQNWTDSMLEKFKQRRGYDPVPWMPVLAGRVVESSEASDKFLWDFRKTIADLIADEHYGQLEATLHEWHMGHYGESHESQRALIADGMEVKKFNEVPMSAMWTVAPGIVREQYGYNADDRESASVAHIYGQNIAAAESMTAASGPWAWSPATLKPTADREFLNGINRIVIHESTHQPLTDKVPGLSLGVFGQWFNRNETWAEQAGPWIDYLGRCSYLLQQGRFSADLLYFYGEDSNLTAIFSDKSPDIPAGYAFDYINADALIHELSVSNGRIRTPGGTSYRVLGLDPYSRHMSLPVLRAMYKLVESGAVVAGPKPEDDPSLADDGAEFQKLSGELFGNGSGVHSVGKGTVYVGKSLGEVLDALQEPPDFDYSKPEKDTRLEFVHRELADGDLYFIDNRSDRAEQVDATFRVTGKEPELWRAESGTTEAASFSIANGRTTMPLTLGPWGTVFVVFRKPATVSERVLPAVTETQLATLNGPWKVDFQADRGAPPSITLDRLRSWSDNSDAGVKYFSGTGTYTTSLDVPAEWFGKGAHLWIDLGQVKNLAEIRVNGKSLGIVWHEPFRVEATEALKTGSNELSIGVTNAWVNRLIGDQQPNAATKYTFTTGKPYTQNSPLQPSGLLGPVRIYSATAK